MIELTSGRKIFIYNGYSYSYHCFLKTGAVRYKCSSRLKHNCKAYAIAYENLQIIDGQLEHNHSSPCYIQTFDGKFRLDLRLTRMKEKKYSQAQIITMVSGKNCLLFNGYTFFFRYKVRLGDKWVCTNFPRCKAFLCVDEALNILDFALYHGHHRKKLHMCSDVQIITSMSGKINAIYQGYTFYKLHDNKNSSRWSCTAYPKCKSYLLLYKDSLDIMTAYINHTHPKKLLCLTDKGFMKIRIH